MDDEISALRRLDLNLLLTFDTLMLTRSATQTAHALHKTQPGVSRDLAKLRHALADALLVAVHGRFVPTERALALHAAVRPALLSLGQALTVAESFDPSQAEGVVDIGIAAHFELLLAGPLLQRLAQRAPRVLPKLHPVHGRDLWRQARLLPLGHALLEKLVQPRKSICAHVLCLAPEIAGPQVDAALARQCSAQWLAQKPFSPLPVLGVPGWWEGNEQVCFYDDPFVFRSARPDKPIQQTDVAPRDLNPAYRTPRWGDAVNAPLSLLMEN